MVRIVISVVWISLGVLVCGCLGIFFISEGAFYTLWLLVLLGIVLRWLVLCREVKCLEDDYLE